MLKKNSLFKTIKTLFEKEKPYTNKQVILSNETYLAREITIQDIKELLAIEREVYAGEIPWTKMAFLSELKSNEPHLYILVQRKQKVIGFIGCRMFSREAHITNVAVLTKYQGKGLGSFLIREIRNFAKENRCVAVTLEVRIRNKKAQRVYRKAGFVKRAIKPGYYADNNEDALEMMLPLEKE